MGNIGFGGLYALHIPGLVGLGSIIFSTLVYSYEQSFMVFTTPARATYFESVAETYLLVILIGIILVAFDLHRTVVDRISESRAQGSAPLTPGWLVPYLFSTKKYRRVFVVSAIVYGIFYAIITSMIVYQPTVDFVQVYNAVFPSAVVGSCCGPSLFVPVVTVYLANHLGLLFIPLTILLLITISALVGLNFSLAAFAYDSKAKSGAKGWVGGLGALVGLFTGCPTCAGLFFANVLGGTSAVSFASLLAYYQPVFILLGIPVLVVTPYLISRSLWKVYRDGCVLYGAAPRIS